jgi:dolichol-phosphate mannosyltransferase
VRGHGVANRHLEGDGVSDWSVGRRIVSRTAQVIGLLILPGVVGRISDPLSGYFMNPPERDRGVALNPLGCKIPHEVLARERFPWVGEVACVFQERVRGGSAADTQEPARRAWGLAGGRETGGFSKL